MGIFDWVKSKTGIWGPSLLAFYFQYSGWINGIILAYGVLLLLSWLNLSRVRDSLTDQMIKQAQEFKNKDKSSKNITINDFKLSWEQAFAFNKFPFIAKQTGFVIHRSTLENARVMITDNDLLRHCSRQLAALGFQIKKRN
jgi:hypothetical protein